MGRKKEGANEAYFEKNLTQFIIERHPNLISVTKLILSRSRKAAQIYSEALNKGGNISIAKKMADAVLYEGLIFSKYDTVVSILATSFPAVPKSCRKELTITLINVCEPIFNKYEISDEFINQSGFNHLIVELTGRIKDFIEENGF